VILGEKFVFIHVPKTAGQSIHAAIGGRVSNPMNAPRFSVKIGSRVSFSFVRNPWARMVSLYRYLCQRHPAGEMHNPAKMREMGFRDWLTDDPFWSAHDVLWGGRKLPPFQQRPQMWWAEGCNFIGQVENIEVDFADACWMAGIKSPSRLPRLNATEGGDWRAEYDGKSRDFVAHHFAEDIKKFGYEFGETDEK